MRLRRIRPCEACLLFDRTLGCVCCAQDEECDEGREELDAHGVLRGSKEVSDLEVLFDPLEEQLDLPALSVEFGDLVCRGLEIVCDQFDCLAGGDPHGDLADRIGHGVAP